LRQLLERGPDLNVLVEKDGAPLTVAIETGRLDVVKLLTGAGADINFLHQEAPIHTAIRLRKREITEYLLDSKCDVTARNKERESPLYAAVRSQDLNLVRTLVERGCEINVLNVNNMSPLYIAVGLRQTPIIKYLLNNDADPNTNGLPCLKLAQDLKDSASINALMAAGAKAQIRRTNRSRQQQSALARTLPAAAAAPQPKPEQGSCMLCRGTANMMKLIPCGHAIVCRKCVDNFVDKHSQCPLCSMGFYATAQVRK
jgi:ankyrin repeat protein